MFARIENGIILEYPIMDIRGYFPNVSFPETILEEHLPVGFAIVHSVVQMPECGPGQKLIQVSPEFDGTCWRQKWECVVFDEQELNTLKSVRARQIRDERNKLLTACDWTQMKDVPETTSSVWCTYRQALRDVTAQETFPLSVSWPRPPQGI